MSSLVEVETGMSVGAKVDAEIQLKGADLCVEREDIRFYNVAPDRLRIEVTVHNRGYAVSQPQPMLLEAAPLGAFVSWRPLKRVQVPMVKAGGSRVVSTEVMLGEVDSPAEDPAGAGGRSQPGNASEGPSGSSPGGMEGETLLGERAPPAWAVELLRSGNFEGVSAWDIAALFSRRSFLQEDGIRRLLVRALEGGADPSIVELFDDFRRPVDSRLIRIPADDRESFSQSVRRVVDRSSQFLSALDLSAMDSSRVAERGNRHWAGNINVHLGSKSVERHQAQELRLYPGKENWALFNLGCRRSQQYCFTFGDAAVEWEARVFYLPNSRDEYAAAREVLHGRDHLGDGIGSGDQVEIPLGNAWMAAMVSPPKGTVDGKLDIDIREIPSGRETTVEFQMMANASGKGLYTF